MKLNIFNISFTSLILTSSFFFTTKIFCQDGINDNLYLKVYVSNTDPNINEVITITAECTSPFDFDTARVFFSLNQEGIDIVDGNKEWKGSLKKGQKIILKVSLKFTKKDVYCPSVYFIDGQLTKAIRIYAGGAFDEDERVSKMRGAIDWCKEELITPHSNPFMPDTSIFHDPEEKEFLKRFNPIDLERMKTKTRLDDLENKRKNDSLLIELRKEYKTLMKQVEEKRRYKWKN